MFFLLISGVEKSMFQNCCNLFKVYPHIAWTIKEVISSSPEMSSTAQLAQGQTEKLYGVKRQMNLRLKTSRGKVSNLSTLFKTLCNFSLNVSFFKICFAIDQKHLT